MSGKNNPTVTSETIAHFLQQTGFVFEMRANEVLSKAGYTTEINVEFLDLEKDTLREIDIIASRVVNDINVHFVVECKQSVTDKWIFICNKKMPRFYRAVKHLPQVSRQILKDKKLFAGFHIFNGTIAVGHNYLASFKGEKKTEHLQIDECVHKLPKALIDLASRSEGGRHLFFPVALFAGQIFAVSYRGKLIVEEVPFLQYYAEFNKEVYRREPEEPSSGSASLVPIWANYEKWTVENQRKAIRSAAIDLTAHYQIDFVTEAGFPDYLAMVEKEIAAIRVSDWPIPELPDQQ